MKTRTLLSITAAALLQITAVSAEEALRSADPNEIFNSIMQTMPGDMKEQIDSAATIQRTVNGIRKSAPDSKGDVQQPSEQFDARQETIDKLPESVREQVRKTMQELERGSTERMLQFKESQNQQKGK